MPTTTAGPLPRLPLTPEALSLRHRSRDLYSDLTLSLRAELDRLGFRERRHQVCRVDGRRGAEILATECLELIAAGATATQIEVLLGWVRSIAEDAFAEREGREVPPLRDAELAESDADVAEDVGQARLLTILASGKHLTTPELEARLVVVRRQAAASSVLVRALEYELRRRQLGLYERRVA